MSLLTIEGLRVEFPSRFGTFTALSGIDLTLERGEIHGLVGESGAGKSTIGAAVIGLIPHPGHISAGNIRFDQQDLNTLDADARHALRGKRIAMIFQDPLTSLNPLFTVEDQLVETILCHSAMTNAEARKQAIALLTEVGIQNPAQRMGDYPHQFSGGMRQRVVIALALCSEPDLIIADEPTTALDVAVQKQILDLITRLTADRGLGVILITHDIGVIAEVTNNVSVLYRGKVVESGATDQVLGRPAHDYTKSLIAAVPRLDQRLERFALLANPETISGDDGWRVEGASAEFASQWLLSGAEQASDDDTPLVSIEGLDVTFYQNRPILFGKPKGHRAVSGVSLTLKRGEVLGLVGESGSGKSTIAKTIVGLNRPSAGRILFDGSVIAGEGKTERRRGARREIQMVFQDPYSSLNNRRRVIDIIAEPLRVYGLAKGKAEIERIVASVLELVGLPQRALQRYPHQFSGGQRQRIAVARALVGRPKFLICDEPTSALDVSIQAQVLNLLKDLQERFALTMLFISHDLPVVRQMADRVAVMKDGNLVELTPSGPFFAGPTEPYSQALLAETPSLELLAPPA